MSVHEILKSIQLENIYQYVREIEGIKHPLDTPEQLDACADYLHNKMESFGLRVREQPFQLEGMQQTYRNIEGSIGAADAPAVVLMAHYDTVYNTPGANDDASGLAVILEIGRVLAQLENPPPVRIVAVTLEEICPPKSRALRASQVKHGLVDSQWRYRKYAYDQGMKMLTQQIFVHFKGQTSFDQAIKMALAEMDGTLPPEVVAHAHDWQEINKGMTVLNSIGDKSRIGSDRWVKEALATGKPVKYAIVFDEIGITSKKKQSQQMPEDVTYDQFTKLFKVDTVNNIGDFELFITNGQALDLAQTFGKCCEDEAVDLPYAWYHVPLTVEQMAEVRPQVFNSDHAPFWVAGIPAMFVFDSTWRNHWGHSMGDTIDRLDFEHMTKIARAAAATVLES